MTLVLERKNQFIKYLFSRQVSNFYIMWGRRDTGKTNFALLIAEILFYLKVLKHISTNIKIYDSPFEIQSISNLEDLRYWCKNEKGKKLYLFDEIGVTIQRRKPMSSLNVELIRQFQLLRKYKLSVIAITIDRQYVDNAILGTQVLDGYFSKPYFKPLKRARKIAYYVDELENFEQSITNIPKTSIHFDTWDSAPFTEKAPVIKPRFTDKELDKMWEWSHGKTCKELGLHKMQLNRLARKTMKNLLEQFYHKSQE